MKTYNKLVRDKIPDIMIQNGAIPKTKILNDKEYFKELNNKLLEEVKEYLDSYEIEELADIEEIIRAILSYKNTSLEDFEIICKEKAQKRGAFKNKIFLISEE